MYCRICGTGFRRRQNDLFGMSPYTVHVLCNDFGTRFHGIEQARNTVICKNVRLHFPVNMVCGHHSHASRCETCLLDNYIMQMINYPLPSFRASSLFLAAISSTCNPWVIYWGRSNDNTMKNQLQDPPHGESLLHSPPGTCGWPLT